MSVKYTLDKSDLTNLVKVVIYSTIASFLGIIVANLTNIDVPTQYAFIVPIINTLLVGLKKYFENRV